MRAADVQIGHRHVGPYGSAVRVIAGAGVTPGGQRRFVVRDDVTGETFERAAGQLWRTEAEHLADRAVCEQAAAVLAEHGPAAGFLAAQVSCLRHRPGVRMLLAEQGTLWVARTLGAEVTRAFQTWSLLGDLTGGVLCRPDADNTDGVAGVEMVLYCPALTASRLADVLAPRERGGALDDLLS